jgi:hypothetical protein
MYDAKLLIIRWTEEVTELVKPRILERLPPFLFCDKRNDGIQPSYDLPLLFGWLSSLKLVKTIAAQSRREPISPMGPKIPLGLLFAPCRGLCFREAAMSGFEVAGFWAKGASENLTNCWSLERRLSAAMSVI